MVSKLGPTTAPKTFRDQASSPGPGSIVPAPHFARAPRLTLEICRGRTRFPQRPVAGPRFFIGSGEGCDLRLGGDVLPTIHSLIQTRGDGLWLEAIAAEPPLLINGERIHAEWLRDGDVLDIGPFQLVAHMIPVRTQFKQDVSVASIPATCDLVDESTDIEEEVDLSAHSAAELVEMLEGEQRMVDEFERNRHAGAEALLHMIRGRRQGVAAEPVVVTAEVPLSMPRIDAPHGQHLLRRPAVVSAFAPRISQKTERAQVDPGVGDDVALLSDLERLCEELNELSNELERRSVQADQREATYAAAAQSLLDAQHELKSQIDAVAEQVAALHDRSKESQSPSRAIA